VSLHDPAMQPVITELFAWLRPKSIVETGTHLGTGTTRMLWNACKAAPQLTTRIVTVECNPEFHAQAKRNLSDTDVDCRLGLTLPRASLPGIERIAIDFEKIEDGLAVDHEPKDRAKLYFEETDRPGVTDDILPRIVAEYEPIDVWLLDSAGHIGFAEYQRVMEILRSGQYALPDWSYFIIDDVNHVKHARTVSRMLNVNGFELVHRSDARFGWAVTRVSASRLLDASAGRD